MRESSARSPRPVLFIIALFAITLAACSSGGSSPPVASVEDENGIIGGDSAETVTVPVRWASAVARDLPTLVANSDEVFVGSVIRLKDQRDEPLIPGVEAAASPIDGKPLREPGTFPISTFEVRIHQTIKGRREASAILLIEQAGGIAKRADGSSVRLTLEGDQLLYPGQQYLFFARQKENGTFTSAPFARLLFTDQGLEPLPRWSNLGAVKTLAGKTGDEAFILIQAAGGR